MFTNGSFVNSRYAGCLLPLASVQFGVVGLKRASTLCRGQNLATVQCVPQNGSIKAVVHYHHGLGDYAMRNEERAVSYGISLRTLAELQPWS
jgi:hypothetical protein